MVRPRGSGSGNGSGLTGVAIMAMARVWFIWTPAPLPAGRPADDGPGLPGWAWAGCWDWPVGFLLGAVLEAGTLGKLDWPGRGFVEFVLR